MITFSDLFKIGIGPSSSHTVGPMIAARRFALHLQSAGLLEKTSRIEVTLFGSLSLTGKGHGTDGAILLGLEGEKPDEIDPDQVSPRLAAIRQHGQLNLLGAVPLTFDENTDLLFNQTENLIYHNGMQFKSFCASGDLLDQEEYYSIGGGFVRGKSEAGNTPADLHTSDFPYPFSSGEQLLSICEREQLSIGQVMLANECALRPEDQVHAAITAVWEVMKACVQRGYSQEDVLPGTIGAQRRAPSLYRSLTQSPEHALRDPLTTLDWVNLYALSVSEENAAGSRVVTAPTNGAAGIIPALLHYYEQFNPKSSPEGIQNFFLTATAIGLLYKENASISGAEVGCQGEVGVACSMAAAGLTAALGGTIYQVENAAEIGMEHNLGLTCDPVQGLVQVPCIERNAMGAIKAINASRIALRGDGKHLVSLDSVIETMRQTGADMNQYYKETSLGGLAVNVVEC
ncbi:MAG: L-serine ammonia-lyase [Chloroflexota bacterium]